MKIIRKVLKETDEIIDVSIKVDKYFSITATIYDRCYYKDLTEFEKKVKDYIKHENKIYRCYASGYQHDEILKHFPEFKIIVDLHLSDLDGQPLHALENGAYWFNRFPEVGFAYWRMNDQDKQGIQTVAQFKAYYNSMLPKWKIEAETAIKLINSL